MCVMVVLLVLLAVLGHILNADQHHPLSLLKKPFGTLHKGHLLNFFPPQCLSHSINVTIYVDGFTYSTLSTFGL